MPNFTWLNHKHGCPHVRGSSQTYCALSKEDNGCCIPTLCPTFREFGDPKNSRAFMITQYLISIAGTDTIATESFSGTTLLEAISDILEKRRTTHKVMHLKIKRI